MLHIICTERRRHDVHVLFGEVSYAVRSVHWRVNNTIRRKFILFSEYQKNFILSRVMKTFKILLVLRTRENTVVFITLVENIYGFHSKRVNIFSLLVIYVTIK